MLPVLIAQKATTALGVLTVGSASALPDLETQILPGFFKILFVIAAFIYVAFAFIVTRQIKVMRSTVVTPLSPLVRIIGYIHFFIAFFIFLAFILFL